ncbi:uncharacterized protein LOC135819810 isoform X1 [Sycon ciliatum]|uniref:uncharacterized protein LOC135819810 isoform X1 n=2 Tax=Sycon ciliatum TaxID=27933 RepID=UPI0031F6D942
MDSMMKPMKTFVRGERRKTRPVVRGVHLLTASADVQLHTRQELRNNGTSHLYDVYDIEGLAMVLTSYMDAGERERFAKEAALLVDYRMLKIYQTHLMDHMDDHQASIFGQAGLDNVHGVLHWLQTHHQCPTLNRLYQALAKACQRNAGAFFNQLSHPGLVHHNICDKAYDRPITFIRRSTESGDEFVDSESGRVVSGDVGSSVPWESCYGVALARPVNGQPPVHGNHARTPSVHAVFDKVCAASSSAVRDYTPTLRRVADRWPATTSLTSPYDYPKPPRQAQLSAGNHMTRFQPSPSHGTGHRSEMRPCTGPPPITSTHAASDSRAWHDERAGGPIRVRKRYWQR